MFFSTACAPGSPRRTAPLLLLLALLLAAAPAPAQVGGTDASGTGGAHTIQGRLVGPSGRRSDLRLKVTLESHGQGSLYVFSDANGNFRFTSLRPGSYRVVVEGGDEFETVTESVVIEASTIRTRSGVIGTPFSRPFTLQIYLRPKSEAPALSEPGVLDASLAGVPKPAADLYLKALEVRKKEPGRAVELLKGALEAHPEFRLALSELGAQYLKLKRPEQAAEALSAALRLAPEDHPTLLNYGIALYDKKDFAEAEAQFRKAARKGGPAPTAHFYLGMILLRRRELDEAERELRAALAEGGGRVAVAHYYLGGIYWSRQDYKRAADELETYLRLAPDAPEAARVRTTIKELRAKK